MALDTKDIRRFQTFDGEEFSINSGQLVGNTLVLNTDTGTVNIPVSGIENAIDFENLTAFQKNALNSCIRGNLVRDAFNVNAGFLLKL